MLRDKVLSFIGFRRQDTAVDKAIALHTESMRNAPKKFKAALNADIKFLSEFLANNTSAQRADSAGDGEESLDAHQDIPDFFDFNADDTVIPDSEERAAQEQKIEDLTRSNYYCKARLACLLIATANYQSWLKAKLRKRPDDRQREVVEYLSNRRLKEMKSFPEYLAELVSSIENSADDKMAAFYHVLLLNCLVELKTELNVWA